MRTAGKSLSSIIAMRDLLYAGYTVTYVALNENSVNELVNKFKVILNIKINYTKISNYQYDIRLCK